MEGLNNYIKCIGGGGGGGGIHSLTTRPNLLTSFSVIYFEKVSSILKHEEEDKTNPDWTLAILKNVFYVQEKIEKNM